MVRSLIISRLNLFMAGLVWFCSWPFAPVPALTFSFSTVNKYFNLQDFFDFSKQGNSYMFLLIVCPFLIIVI